MRSCMRFAGPLQALAWPYKPSAWKRRPRPSCSFDYCRPTPFAPLPPHTALHSTCSTVCPPATPLPFLPKDFRKWGERSVGRPSSLTRKTVSRQRRPQKLEGRQKNDAHNRLFSPLKTFSDPSSHPYPVFTAESLLTPTIGPGPCTPKRNAGRSGAGAALRGSGGNHSPRRGQGAGPLPPEASHGGIPATSPLR